MKSHTYEKSFSRDLCLSSVEAWVRGETINPKGWTKQQQPFLPYIIAQRTDDTVIFYYDQKGVEWIQNLLVKFAKSDSLFLEKIAITVVKKIEYIRPIYEEGKSIKLPLLKRFLIELEEGYPWFEALWWFCQMEEEKLIGLNLENIQQIRLLIDKVTNGSDTVIRKSLLNIYPKLKDLSSVLTTAEIQAGTIPPKEELEKRYKGYFFTNNQLFTNSTKPKIAKKMKITFKDEVIKHSKQLEGYIAYKGLVRGFVKKVMGHRQINQIKEGEILISPMTVPDFLPAMIKAAAIVTDEGGILSHAAIIAREFKKPTIVGTKLATKRFKDGDFVEVNANEGVVKLISHAAITAKELKKPTIVGTKYATQILKDGDYIEVDANKGKVKIIKTKNTK